MPQAGKFLLFTFFLHGVFSAFGECREVKVIRIFGNMKTKPDIIIRELSFKEGSNICDENLAGELEFSRQQLYNTQLFNEISFRVDTTTIGEIQISVDLKERWYVWPIPKIEVADRNFNQWWLSKDLSRINFGLTTVIQNLRGRNETLRLNLMAGYTQKVGFEYYFPFINKAKTIGLGLGGDWMANKEIWYITRFDKVQFFRLDDRFAHQRWEANARLVHRPRFYSTHTLGVKIGAGQIADTVLSKELNPMFFSSGSARQQYVGTFYRFVKNKVDYINYPTVGFINELQAEFHLLDGGKSPSVGIIKVNHRRYAEPAKGVFMVGGLFAGANLSPTLPYHLSRALGYRDFVRGFEYYVIDGRFYALFKGNLKFRLFPEITTNLPIINHSKFKKIPLNAYFGPFFDLGYVNGKRELENNELPNTPLFGTGLGLDITSYYDRVMRIEYSYNSLRQFGWFVHFRKSI